MVVINLLKNIKSNFMNKLVHKTIKALIINTISVILLFSSTLFSQVVGVNTLNPFGVFHVDGKGDNNTKGTPTPSQQTNDFIVTENGDIGIGITSPEAKLHIYSTEDPLKIEGLEQGDIYKNNILLLDNNDNLLKAPSIQKLSIPSPTVLILENTLNNFLINAIPGAQYAVPMKMIRNSIEGLTYNENSATINFPEGTYQLIFDYEATHPNCTISSYFVDFPSIESQKRARVHSVTTHLKTKAQTNHGGTFSYNTIIKQPKSWKIAIGRGVSGTCEGKDMTLKKDSTQLLIYRLGD